MKNLRMINSNKQHEACNSIDSASNFEGDITIFFTSKVCKVVQ